ncbi:MAG TPA: acetyl-CoA hydrolase/transferase C-terminal domain-containing protein [Dehalococcoidia bacterium]|nr:acetyl-CoA hydrolase/transferase C-terminal domain-containing protein [Dehalococcoidia bacterium]
MAATPRPRRLSPAEAVSLIRPDDQVSIAQAEPEALIQALIADRERLRGLRLLVAPVLGKGSYAAPDVVESFAITTLYVGGVLRRAVRAGAVDYIPTSQVELLRLVQLGRVAPSVVVAHVAEPDDRGYAFGLMADWNLAVAKGARLVIAQVNPNMPRTRGDNRLTAEDVDVVVEVDEPLIESPVPEVGPVERRIGEHVAGLVPDGATIETGIGAIPAAVAQGLSGHRDLGVHTATFTDALRDLYEAGVVTNQLKEIDAGKMVAAAIMGTRDFYAWLHENPVIEAHLPTYVHAIATLTRFRRLIALNSAIEVDLTGQVNAEAIGGWPIATVGGGVDFARGAMANPESKSIIALPSMAGSASRIVPAIAAGQPVTYARHDVHYIVTEYGVADIRGRPLRERAALIAELAHPDHRDALREAARRFPPGGLPT